MRICWARCITPPISPAASCRWMLLLIHDDWATADTISPIGRGGVGIAFPRGTMTMIELLRRVWWETILGYKRSSWSRSTVLGPRHLVGVAFTDEATALAVVAFGLRFVTFLLAPSARPAASLGSIGELPLPLLMIDLNAGFCDFSRAGPFETILRVDCAHLGLRCGTLMQVRVCST